MAEQKSERGWVVGFNAETEPYKRAVEVIEKLNERTASSYKQLASEIERSGVAAAVSQISTSADRALAKMKMVGGAARRGGVGAGGVRGRAPGVRDLQERIKEAVKFGRADKGVYAQAQSNIKGYVRKIKELKAAHKQTGASAQEVAKDIQRVGTASGGATTDLSKMEKYLKRMSKTSKKSARGIGQNAEATHRLREEFQKISGPIARREKQLEKAARVNRTVLSSEEKVIAKFKQAFGRLGVWTIATGVIYMFVQAMRQVVGTLIEVQYGMAQLEKVMVPGANFEKIEAGFWAIAKRYGLAIEDVVRSGKIFAQQGRSQVEVLALTKAALLGVTAAGLEEKQAIEAVTAAQKIFNIEAANSTSIIDKLARVQARHAVTAQDLADAIKTVGPVVKILHGNIDDVIGITTALVAVTRQSGKYVANAMKTVFARFARPTTRRKFMELMGGFDIKETEKEFKPLNQILRGLRDRWTGLSGAQRLAVAQAAGGIRRYKDFVVLMNNYAEVVTATRDSQEAFNDAQRMSAIEAGTLKRRLLSLQAVWLELGSTILKGAFFPQVLGGMTAGLAKYGAGLEKISKISPPVGAITGIASLVLGILAAEKALRLLLHSMVPTVKTGTAIVSVFGWIVKGLKRVVIHLGRYVVGLTMGARAYRTFGRSVRAFSLVKFLVNPWVLATAAVVGLGIAVYAYSKRMRELESGKAILDSFTEKWDEHSVTVSAAQRSLESYAKTINDISKEGREFKPFRMAGITLAEAQRAREQAAAIARGQQTVITPRGLTPGTVTEAAMKARGVETIADVRGLFAGTRAATLGQNELLSALTRTDEAYRSMGGNLKAIIAEMLDLGDTSDNVLRALVTALRAPRTEVEVFVNALRKFKVPEDQIDRFKIAVEELRKSLKKGPVEKTLGAMTAGPGGGLFAVAAGKLAQKRIEEYKTKVAALISLLGRWLAATEKQEKVGLLKKVLTTGIKEAEDHAAAIIKVKDAYFEITDPIQRTLENMEAQAVAFKGLGLGFKLYERQLGVVKKAAAELTTQQLILTNAYRNAQHAFARATKLAGAVPGEPSRQALDLMEKTVKRRKAALDLFVKENTGQQEYLQNLMTQLKPLSEAEQIAAKTVRWTKEKLSLTEKHQAAVLKLNQLEEYGADNSRFIVQRVQERVRLENEMYPLRLAALEQEFNLGKMADDFYKNRKATLEIQHDSILVGIKNNAVIQARQALLDRERTNTEAIRGSVREALADWEGLSSGKGIVNLFDTIARRQRELLADAVADLIPSKVGDLFVDPRRQVLQEELVVAQSVAATIEAAWVRGATTAGQITAAKLPDAVASRLTDTAVVKGAFLAPSAGIVAAAVRAAEKPTPDKPDAEKPKPTPPPSEGWSRRGTAGVMLAGMGTVALSKALGGNAANAQMGATMGMLVGTMLPGGALTAAIGSVLGGLIGGLFGGKGQEDATTENTRALRDNTQTMADLSQMIISAPATFMMPAVKGQIPNFGNGGDVTRSGMAYVHRGETITTGPGEININVTQREGEDTQDFAERVWKLADAKYDGETRRSGSRGRMIAS